MDDVDNFSTSNWQGLSHQQRVDALQGLENNMASRQGRAPRIVTPDWNMPRTRHGEYKPENADRLHINFRLIDNNNGSYQAMQTMIHEGRHAYQHDCVQGKIIAQPEDQGKVKSWKHNMPIPGSSGVYCKNGIDYRYQPVEADAYNYSKEVMNGLISQYANDPAFIQHSSKRDLNDRRTEWFAKLRHGKDYEQDIRQDIDQRYQAKLLQQSRKQTISDHPDMKQDKFDFKNDKEQRQQGTWNSTEMKSLDSVKASEQSHRADASPQQQAKFDMTFSQGDSSSKNGASTQAYNSGNSSMSTENYSKYKASGKQTSTGGASYQSKLKEGLER